jgi:hypothetical protein
LQLLKQTSVFRFIAESEQSVFSRGKSPLNSLTQRCGNPEIGFDQSSDWTSQELTAWQRARMKTAY